MKFCMLRVPVPGEEALRSTVRFAESKSICERRRAISLYEKMAWDWKALMMKGAASEAVRQDEEVVVLQVRVEGAI